MATLAIQRVNLDKSVAEILVLFEPNKFRDDRVVRLGMKGIFEEKLRALVADHLHRLGWHASPSYPYDSDSDRFRVREIPVCVSLVIL